MKKATSLILAVLLLCSSAWAGNRPAHSIGEPGGFGAPSASQCDSPAELGSEYKRVDVDPPTLYVCGLSGWAQIGGGSSGITTFQQTYDLSGEETEQVEAVLTLPANGAVILAASVLVTEALNGDASVDVALGWDKDDPDLPDLACGDDNAYFGLIYISSSVDLGSADHLADFSQNTYNGYGCTSILHGPVDIILTWTNNNGMEPFAATAGEVEVTIVYLPLE